MSETDSEVLAWARDRYGSLTGPERDRLFALAQAGIGMAAENERLRADVQKLDSECTDLATDLSTQRHDNASLAEPWKVVNPLRAEAARLSAENEKLRALLKRHFARKPEPECQIVDDKKCDACVCGWAEWKTDEMALEDETRAALQDKSDE